MPVVLDATPGSPTANSFETVEGADAYHNELLYASAWTSVTDQALKAQALITATRLIVEAINGWQGYPTYSSQRLPLPRTGLMSPNGNAVQPSNQIPQPLKDATSEYARRLLEMGQLPDEPLQSSAFDLKSVKAGSVALEFFGAADTDGQVTLPAAVFNKIAYLVTSRPGSIVVPLERG